MTFIYEPHTVPVVLSPDEVTVFWRLPPGLKYKAALSVAYGAGLRVSEIAALKISDVDSERMLIRVEQHTFRHSFATHLLEQNIDIHVIQVLACKFQTRHDGALHAGCDQYAASGGKPARSSDQNLQGGPHRPPVPDCTSAMSRSRHSHRELVERGARFTVIAEIF